MSCHLVVEQDEENRILSVTGNNCNRGDTYARRELLSPMRILTTTVAIEGALHRRLPVILTAEIPKNSQQEVMKELSSIYVQAPIAYGQILKENICGLGVDVKASRSMPKFQNE